MCVDADDNMIARQGNQVATSKFTEIYLTVVLDNFVVLKIIMCTYKKTVSIFEMGWS